MFGNNGGYEPIEKSVNVGVNDALRDTFWLSNALAALCHIGLAIYVLTQVIDRPWEVPFQIGYSNWTETEEDLGCGEEGNICTISLAQKDAGVANVGLIVPFFSIISGLHHVSAALFAESYIATVTKTKANPYRATDYAFSSGLMIAVVSILFRAPSDPLFLVVVASLQFLTCFAGYAIELLKASEDLSFAAKALFGISVFTYALLWTSLLIPFEFAIDGAPIAVTVFIIFMVSVFSLFPLIFLITWSYIGADDLVRREILYTSASFLSKIPLLVLFYTGVTMRSGSVQFEGTDLNTEGDALSDSELYGVFGGTVAIGVVFGLFFICRAGRGAMGG
jgi:hypothetical protein